MKKIQLLFSALLAVSALTLSSSCEKKISSDEKRVSTAVESQGSTITSDESTNTLKPTTEYMFGKWKGWYQSFGDNAPHALIIEVSKDPSTNKIVTEMILDGQTAIAGNGVDLSEGNNLYLYRFCSKLGNDIYIFENAGFEPPIDLNHPKANGNYSINNNPKGTFYIQKL